MEIHKLITDILEGKVRTLAFDNVAFVPDDKNIAGGALGALNFARLAFAAEGKIPDINKILTLLSSRKMVEDALAICRELPNDVRLEVEDVYRIPLFEVTLKMVSMDYDSPSTDHCTKLLEDLRTSSSSAVILITRYPDVITCVRLKLPPQEVFVLFNPRDTSERGPVASLTFSTSTSHIVQRLCAIYPTGKHHLTQGSLDLQPKLLEKCAAHVFVPRTIACDSRTGEDSLIVASLTLLTLKAELEQVTRDNGIMKSEKQRLERTIIELAARLEEKQAQNKCTQSFKPSQAKRTHGASVLRGPQLPHSSHSTGRYGDLFGSEVDSNMELALQLQAAFDSENDFLIKQRHELMRTAQRQYHCGICLDDFPEDDAVRIDTCGHEICRDCVRGHVCAKIEEHRFPVLCPVCTADNKNQRPGLISGTLVQLLGVSEKQWETWVEMELAQFSIPFTCRKCHHSAFVDKQDLEASPEIHCPFPACDHVWCRKCQQTIDPMGPKHSCDGTSELDHLMRQQGWRYCPNCKTPIQKIQGCNHLSCIAPGCNTHFCYACGQTINRTAIPREIQEGKTAHFRACPIV